MKIELSQSEISTVLKALSPFTNPQEWENEKFDIVLSAIKDEIIRPFIRSCEGNFTAHYPGEWGVSTIINAVRSGKYFNILIVGDVYVYNEIYNVCHLEINKASKNYFQFYTSVNCKFLNNKYGYWENDLSGYKFDCLFL
jgi:hypothetical protein